MSLLSFCLKKINPQACLYIFSPSVLKKYNPSRAYVSYVLLSEIFTRGGMFSSVLVS